MLGPPQPITLALGGVEVQTSLMGMVLARLYGRHRLSPNMIDYFNFQAKPLTGKNKASKKGNVTYDYGASIIFALCQGGETGIQAVLAAWDTQGVLPINDTTESYTVPTGGGTYFVNQQLTFKQDLGVVRQDPFTIGDVNDFGSPGPVTLTGINSTPMQPTSGSSLPAGVYRNHSNGSYDFGAADAGKVMFMTYSYAPPNITTSSDPDPITSLALEFFNGAPGQAPWPFTASNFPARARAYARIAGMRSELLDLGTGGAMPNLSFDVVGLFAGGLSGGGGGTSPSVWAPDNNAIVDVNAEPGGLAYDITVHGPGSAATAWHDNITSADITAFTITGLDPLTTYYIGWDGSAESFTAIPDPVPTGMIPVAIITTPPSRLFSDGAGPSGGTSQSNGAGNATAGAGLGGDANFLDIIYDIMTDDIDCLGIPPSAVGDNSNYDSYCVANGLTASLKMTSRRAASDYINDLLMATNAEIIRDGFLLQIASYGDTTIVANGVTFTPPTDPIFDLTMDSFMREKASSKPPVKISRKDPSDAFNSVTVQYANRGNNYQMTPVNAQSLDFIDKYTLRPDSDRSWDFFTSQLPAIVAAQTILNRNTTKLVEYQFTLPQMPYIVLNSMDLVTLPSEALGAAPGGSSIPVRILTIDENAKGDLAITAENFPWGCNGPTVYPRSLPQGGTVNANLDPGPVGLAHIFELTPRLRGANPSMQLGIAVSGLNPSTWGGCTVWMSKDGGNSYEPQGFLPVCSIIGQITNNPLPAGLDPELVNEIDLLLYPGIILPSFTSDQENALSSSLSVLETKLTDLVNAWDPPYELVSFGAPQIVGPTAPLQTNGPTIAWKIPVGAGKFIRRGVYGTPNTVHRQGGKFVFTPGGLFTMNLDPALVGTQLFFKFTGENTRGGQEQELDSPSVPAFTFTPTGLQQGLANSGYSISPNPVLSQVGTGSTTLHVAPFIISGTLGVASYLGDSVARPGAAPPPFTGLSNTGLYYVTVYDPSFQGENADSSVAQYCTYFCDTVPANVHFGEPGYYYLGSLQMVAGVPPAPPPPAPPGPDPGDPGMGTPPLLAA